MLSSNPRRIHDRSCHRRRVAADKGDDRAFTPRRHPSIPYEIVIIVERR